MPRREPSPSLASRLGRAAGRLALRHAPAGFVAIAGLAVVLNALLMQPGEHPAPLIATRAQSDSAKGDALMSEAQMPADVPRHRPEPVAPERVASERVAPERVAPERVAMRPPAPDPVVFAVQRALTEAAYGPIEVDGLKGRQTTEALRHFQLDQGLAVNGEIDRPTLERLATIGAMPTDP